MHSSTEPSLLKPPPLRPGAHLRVVSLSAPVAHHCPRRLERGCAALEALGYSVSLAEHARAAEGHMAASPEARAQDFMNAWLDPRVDGVISSIGGSVTNQILEHLDFERLAAAPPKALIGYSDTTVLMVALYARLGLVSFQGPAVLPQFGECGGLHPFAREAFQIVGHRPDASAPWSFPEAPGLIREHLRWEREDERPRVLVPQATRRCLRPGRATGPLLPANLGCLLLLAGTPLFPRTEGVILVLEEDEAETPESLDRYLTHLRSLGVIHRCSGLVFGRLPDAVGAADEVVNELLLRATRGTQLPVLVGFEMGHVDPALTVPIGVRAELDASEKALTLLEAPTEPRS
jgi:muramoyltetrapeptide carboxypeptidase